MPRLSDIMYMSFYGAEWVSKLNLKHKIISNTGTKEI